MIDQKKIKQLDSAFQRILILPMTRSSFRQMQNVIFQLAGGSPDEATKILDALLLGQKHSYGEEFQKFVDRYSVPANVAREVAEKGEFVSLVTSDIIYHPQMPILGNRIRRIDGKEFDFITDPEGGIQLLQHFSFRLLEMQKGEKSENILKGMKSELSALRELVDQLLNASSE